MCCLLEAVGYDGCFNGIIDTVLRIGLAPRGLDQCLNATFFVGMLIAIKGVTGDAKDFACLGYVAQLTGQIEQADPCVE